MKWSDKVPKQDGWYWMRKRCNCKRHFLDKIHLAHLDDSPYAHTCDARMQRRNYQEDGESLWIGPLAQPSAEQEPQDEVV